MTSQEKQAVTLTHSMALGASAPSPIIPVDVVDANGIRYQGNFRFRRPSIYDTAAICVRASELQSRYNPETGEFEQRQVTPIGATIAHQIATLESMVVESPAWWNMKELDAPEVLGAVWEAYSRWRAGFRPNVQEKPHGDSANGRKPAAVSAQ